MQDDARLIRREVDRCRDILSRMRLDLGEDFSSRTPVRLGDLGDRLRGRLWRRLARRASSRREHPGRVLGFAPLLVIPARPDKARPGCDGSRAFCFFNPA